MAPGAHLGLEHSIVFKYPEQSANDLRAATMAHRLDLNLGKLLHFCKPDSSVVCGGNNSGSWHLLSDDPGSNLCAQCF